MLQHLDIHREGNSPTQMDKVPWVTMPIDIGGLVDSLHEGLSRESFKMSTRGSCSDYTRQEVSELDVAPQPMHQQVFPIMIAEA